MKLEGSVESVEKMESLLTKSFPARLVKDGGKPFMSVGMPQRSPKFTRKWQLFPPEEMGRLFPQRANVEFYYDCLGNRAVVRISDAGMNLLGQRFAALVMGNGLSQRSEEPEPIVEVEPEPVPAVQRAA